MWIIKKIKKYMRWDGIPFTISGNGVIHVNPSDILNTEKAKLQIQKFGKLKTGYNYGRS